MEKHKLRMGKSRQWVLSHVGDTEGKTGAWVTLGKELLQDRLERTEWGR